MRSSRPLSAALAALALTAGTLTPLTPAHAASAPVPDLLDISFQAGVARDAAQNIQPEIFGEPSLGTDAGLLRGTATFDGTDDAFLFRIKDSYSQLADGFAVECSFRVPDATTTGEDSLCGAKEGGGFAMVIKDGKAGFMLHDGSGYKFTWADVDPGQWYHAVGVFGDGQLRFFLNGKLAASTPAAATMQLPPDQGAYSLGIGADTSNTAVGQHARATVASAKLFSGPISDAEVTALHQQFAARPQLDVKADVLDVDFRDGTAADRAQNLPVTTYGAPEIALDTALGRNTARFDGEDDAYSYPLAGRYGNLVDGLTVECYFYYDGEFPSGEASLCSNKEAGGFSMVMYGSDLTFTVHTDGYKAAKQTIEPHRWYHAVGVYDGQESKLYVNGVLASAVPAGPKMTLPPNVASHHMVLGGDSKNGGTQFWAAADIASAKIFSDALTDEQIAGLAAESMGDAAATQLELTSSTPAQGAHLTRATTFDVAWNRPDLARAGLSYTVDGQPIRLGETIGAGMTAGEHVIAITGKDAFGRPINQRITFTSSNIPTAGGVDEEQGKGTVTLQAIADNPTGGDVTTTFYAGTATTPEKGFQGTVPSIPTTLEFAHDEAASLDGPALPGDDQLFASASTAEGAMPFQRYDVPADALAGQRLVWTGRVDPKRAVELRVWDAAASAWVVAGEGRGVADQDLVVTADLSASQITGDQVHVMVVGVDPFADDIENEIRPSFEDPADYDFAITHHTDTQYLSEGAAERSTPEERAIWEQAYRAVPEWIVKNADARKIVYSTHTGDIIEDWASTSYADKEAQRAIAVKQFEVASSAQRILDDAGMPNDVLAGNHDTLAGTEADASSLYNRYFGPARYEALEASARSKAVGYQYTPWKEGDNSNHYTLFSAGGLDFVTVHLSYLVTPEEAAWADSVFKQFPDRNGMIMTHAYNAPSNAADGRGAGFSADGALIEREVLRKNPNVFLVLAGHEHGVSIVTRKDVGTPGNHVTELLADYQFYEVTAKELGLSGMGGHADASSLRFGSSFLRVLQFDVDASELVVDTFSPFLENFGAHEYDTRKRYAGPEDDTTLPIQLETRRTSFNTDGLVLIGRTDEVIGEDTARSGWPAEVTWSGLTAGQPYAWYSVSRDAASGAELPGEVAQFGWFVATDAGTDVTPPVLTLPELTTVREGETFDPMAGVSATDNVGGDLTDAIQVVDNSVDTTKPGTYSLGYLVKDANGNQSVATRAVVVVAKDVPVQNGPFKDVAWDAEHVEAIQWMKDEGYATGWDDGTFRPVTPVKRDAMVAFLYRLAGSPSVAGMSESFTDVEPGMEHYDAMVWAANVGVAKGWEDGTFRPVEPIDRNAMMAFMYRFAGSPAYSAPSASAFTDVEPGDMFYTEIMWAHERGITKGWPDGTFRPLEDTNRDATAAFLHRFAELNGMGFNTLAGR